MNLPINLWSRHEHSNSLMWLMRDVDKDAENLPAEFLIKNLFSDQVQQKQEASSDRKQLSKLKKAYGKHYGYSITWPNE